MIAILLVDFLGLVCGVLLFWKRRRLTQSLIGDTAPTVSVVIPARNEERNLAGLLTSLKQQTHRPDEVIVVDDGSTDRTAEIAQDYGATVLRVDQKPDGWLGKSWACQRGSEAAQGDILLFVDADVCFKPEAIRCLLAESRRSEGVISVLPYHRINRAYEHLSMFFSLIQVAGNGAGLPFGREHTGLFGPVILIKKQDYAAVGGHQSVKDSVVDDLALGRTLSEHRIKDRLFWGEKLIEYRMYPDGLRQLTRGWQKNMAAGAAMVPMSLMLLTFWFLTGCIASLVDLVLYACQQSPLAFVAAGLSIGFGVLIAVAARRIGSFRWPYLAAYPFYLLVFMAIFVLSVVCRTLGIRVNWKDRKVVT